MGKATYETFSDVVGVLIDTDTGDVWNGTAYATPPSGAIPAGSLLTPARVGDFGLVIFTTPTAADAANWTILVFNGTTANSTDSTAGHAQQLVGSNIKQLNGTAITGAIPADVKMLNSVNLTGAGTAGNEWGA